MNLKKYLTINIFIIFAITFLSHFAYDIFKTNIFAIFFPVNESIFEHMKMIYTSFLISGIIQYFIFKKSNISYNNFFTNLLVTSLSSIVSFLIIWLPIYYRIGENMAITIIILFISICISQVIAFYILNSNNSKIINYLSLLLIISISIVFAYFTYNPLINDFFFDPIKEVYGINTYLIK